MDQDLQGVPLPAPRRVYTRLLRAKVGSDVRLISWVPRVIGLWTHYDGWQSSPCLTGRADCPGCRLGWVRLWKGYLAGYSQEHHCRALLEIPEFTVRRDTYLSDGTVDLRGALVTVHRCGPKPASRCTSRVQLNFRGVEDRDEPPDVLVWFCEAVGIKLEAPAPPTLRLPPEADEGVPL